MDELISRITTNVGIDAETARKAVGHDSRLSRERKARPIRSPRCRRPCRAHEKLIAEAPATAAGGRRRHGARLCPDGPWSRHGRDFRRRQGNRRLSKEKAGEEPVDEVIASIPGPQPVRLINASFPNKPAPAHGRARMLIGAHDCSLLARELLNMNRRPISVPIGTASRWRPARLARGAERARLQYRQPRSATEPQARSITASCRESRDDQSARLPEDAGRRIAHNRNSDLPARRQLRPLQHTPSPAGPARASPARTNLVYGGDGHLLRAEDAERVFLEGHHRSTARQRRLDGCRKV